MGLVRSVDLAELRAFCAAVDLGSLGSAARLLRVSQPALSKRMRALEALAGAQLLVRSPRGIATTEAGERLYVEARKLLAQADAVEDEPTMLGGCQPKRDRIIPAVVEPRKGFPGVLPPARHCGVEPARVFLDPCRLAGSVSCDRREPIIPPERAAKASDPSRVYPKQDGSRQDHPWGERSMRATCQPSRPSIA